MGFNMDKRWIYILIILIIGTAAMFYIVENSTTVGSATVAVGTYTATVPNDYNIFSSENDYVVVINRQTNEKIHLEDFGKGNSTEKNFEKQLSKIENDENVTDYNTTTETYNNFTFKSITYEKLPNNTINKVSLFMEFNHTFMIKSMNFKDPNTLESKSHFIIDSIKRDYKKTQD